MAEVFVITCNDSVEHVVIGDRDVADDKMEKLAIEHFNRNKHVYQEQCRNFRYPGDTYKYYRQHTNWAVRPTPHSCGMFVGIVDEHEEQLKRQKREWVR